MSDKGPTPTVGDLQGQIDVKMVLLYALDALADAGIDIIGPVQRRIPIYTTERNA